MSLDKDNDAEGANMIDYFKRNELSSLRTQKKILATIKRDLVIDMAQTETWLCQCHILCKGLQQICLGCDRAELLVKLPRYEEVQVELYLLVFFNGKLGEVTTTRATHYI